MFIDVVVPVFNALSQTKRCVESVLRFSTGPYRFLLINDCSDSATTNYLRAVSEQHGITLLENERNLGFLGTANRGLRFSHEGGEEGCGFGEKSEVAILLNSDTIVTTGWLDCFRACFSSDEKIGLATAVSNNAENLSISIPPGYNIHSMATLVQRAGAEVGYPDITTAIGFCMGIRRSVLDRVGYFDKVYGRGYGEDSDYHFQALAAGFRSVLVSTCFVYHESHASFSDSAITQMIKNRPIFDERWGTIYKNELARQSEQRPVERLAEFIESERIHAGELEHDILFIIPTARLFGGIIVVYEVVNRLIDSGLSVGVIVASGAEKIEMDLGFSPYFVPPTEWRSSVPKAKVYVATHYETCPYAFAACEKYPQAKMSYLVQGYESWFPEASIDKVVNTYRAIPNKIVVSSWLQEMLERWGESSTLIPNGVDSRMFVPPDNRWTQERRTEPVTIMTLLRHDPQGGWRFAFKVLQDLKKRCPEVKILAVGELCKHPDIRSYIDFPHEHVDRKSLRRLYHQADVFFDCSMVQGFGLMGLEAMSAGVAVVTSATGGVREYARADNAILVPVGDSQSLVDALVRLAQNAELREELSRKGRETAISMDWDLIVSQYESYFLDLLSSMPDQKAQSEEFAGRLSYFINEFMRRSEEENWILQSANLMQRELAESILPARFEELCEREGKQKLHKSLLTIPIGYTLAKFYDVVFEAMRKAQRKEYALDEHELSAKRFLDHLKSVVPRHKKEVNNQQSGKEVI